MVSHDAWQHTFQFFLKNPIIAEAVDAQLTSDAGLLPIRAFRHNILEFSSRVLAT